MDSEKYCLRWNDHRTILLSNFERLLQNHSSVDCTLAAEGQCLRAHKVVLSACSPYFELMLNQDKEKHPIIFLKDMKFKELQAILEYMYRGEVVIPHDQLTTLLQAAESLQIKGLGCGEKTQPQSGSRSSIQAHKQAQPQPQPQQKTLQQSPVQIVQKQVQPVRQSIPSIRGLEVTQVVHEPAPQVVDLTDEPRAVNTSPVAHHVQEAAKRSMPQNATRAKRLTYPVSTSERFNQNNVSTLSPTTLQNIYQQQNITMTNAGQSGGTTMIATAIPVSSLAQTPPKSNPAVSRQANEPSGYSALQILMPPAQRPETHDIRDSGNQPVAHKPKPRAVSIQKRHIQGNMQSSHGQSLLQTSPGQNLVQASPGQNLVQASPGQSLVQSSPGQSLVQASPGQNLVQASPGQGLLQTSRGQSNSPVALPSQNTVLVSTPRVSAPTIEKTTSLANESVADKADTNDSTASLPEVQQANDQLDSEAQDSLHDSVEDPSGETAQEPSPENPIETPKKSPALDKPGPSGVGKAKSGRRGRVAGTERRFPCPECDKRFTQKSYLDNHLRIHDGECYECDNCMKTFLTRATLLKHLRAHAAKAASNTPQKCQLCGATFPNASDLEKHLTEHTMSGADDN